MYSKRVEITSGDLTSGQIYIDSISLTKTFTASNNSRTEVYYPSTVTLYNRCGADVDIIFFGNDEEYGEYLSGSLNYGAIRFVPDDTQFTFQPFPKTKSMLVSFGAGMDKPFIMNFFQYRQFNN